MVGEWVNGLLEGAVLEKLPSGGKVYIIVSIVTIGNEYFIFVHKN